MFEHLLLFFVQVLLAGVLNAFLDSLEEALAAVSSHVGHRVAVGEAVSWLRRNGHGSLTKRLQKLSKVRNATAHPDTWYLS